MGKNQEAYSLTDYLAEMVSEFLLKFLRVLQITMITVPLKYIRRCLARPGQKLCLLYRQTKAFT